ncbi:MAG: hypothetical protein IPL22_11695 [Bacteroidetes bacterium]|nr:hypothetical protein [Bacteroidota bacterium]
MNINRSNYEEVFIDYFDGNLAAEKVAELFLFLEKNPDLKEEFESFSGEPIPGFDEVFDNKEALKRGAVNSENIDYFLIGDIENNLTKSEQEQLQMFLKENPAFVKEHDLFKVTIVAPDLSVKFPNKGNLRQPVPFAFSTNSIMRFAIAAVLLLMVIGGGYILFTKSSKPEAPVLAEDQPVDSASFNENSVISERNFATNTPTPESNQKPEQVNNTSDQNGNNLTSAPKRVKSNPTQRFASGTQNPAIAKAPVSTDKNIYAEPLATIPAVTPTINNAGIAMEIAGKPQQIETLTSNTNASASGNYLSVWEAMRKAGDEGIRKIAGAPSDELAFVDDSENSKVKVIDVVEKGIEKISNDKVKLDAGYNETAERNSYRFSFGKLRIEKN